MNYIELTGTLAAVLTTLAALPQVIKLHKTKVVDGLSIWYYIILITGICLWLVYGVMINSLPLIFANVFSILIIGSILFGINKYKVKKTKPNNCR